MVQVLVDFRHLARVRLVDMARTSSGAGTVRATFEISSRLAPRSQTFSAVVPAPPNSLRREILTRLWLEVLNTDLESIRRFVFDSARLPSLNEPLDMYPLGGDDDVDKIDASLVTGTLDGSMIRPGSLTSEQIRSLDASKLTGKLDPERLRHAGLTFEMLSGTLCGSRIEHGTLDHRHIVSVDAATVTGTLTHAELAPNSVHDHHIASISWERVSGEPTDEFVSAIRLESLGGRLRVDQLPTNIPPDRIDFGTGLDLSLFTRGRLPIECLPDGVIEARHVSSVNTTALVGQIDGHAVAPGSIPPSAIMSVDAESIVGDLKVEGVETGQLTVTGGASIGELTTDGPVSCAHIEVASCVAVTGDAAIDGEVACDSLDAGGTITAPVLSCRELAASVVRARDVDADRVHASTLDCKYVNSRDIFVDTAVASDVDAGTVSARSMHVDAVGTDDLAVAEAHISRLYVERFDADRAEFETCAIDGTATVCNVDVAGDIDIGSSLTASRLGCTSLVSERVTVAGAVETANITASSATIHGTCTVSDTLDVAGSLDVAGELRASGLVVDGRFEAGGLVCDRIDIEGACEIGGNVTVEQSTKVSGDVECASLSAGAISSASVRTGNLTVSNDVDAREIRSESVEAIEVGARDIVAERLAVTELRADSVAVDSEFRANELRCSHVLTPKLDVATRLDVRDALTCRDLTCYESLDADSVRVTDTVHTERIVSTDDIVISGVSVSELLRDMENRVASAELSCRSGRPLVFERREYYADTQYDSGHDTLQAISPAFPYGDPISYDLPDPSAAQGLSITSTGDILGRGTIAGSFPVATRASIKGGSDTHTLQIDATFTIFGPPSWITPDTFEAVRGSLFDIPLAADDATGFEDGAPLLDGVNVQGSSFVGVLEDVGVYSIGATALRALDHNDHVLRTDKTFDVLVRPPAPFVSAGGELAPDALVAAGAMSLNNTLVGTADNATALELLRTDTVHAPVVWITDATLSSRVGDIAVPLDASGAVTYSVSSRGTLPVDLALTEAGVLQGPVSKSVAFTVGVRASGTGGAWRPAQQGGHVDRVFDITVRPPPVDFSQIDGGITFTAGVGIVIEALHDTFDPNADYWYAVQSREVV